MRVRPDSEGMARQVQYMLSRQVRYFSDWQSLISILKERSFC